MDFRKSTNEHGLKSVFKTHTVKCGMFKENNKFW